MAVDASLLNPGAALNAKPMGYIDPIASQAKVMQLKSAGQAQKLQDQQILQNQTTMDLQAKRQLAFKGSVKPGPDGVPTIDYPTLFERMAVYGDPELLSFQQKYQEHQIKLQTDAAAQKKAQQEAEDGIREEISAGILADPSQAAPLIQRAPLSIVSRLIPNWQDLIKTPEGARKVALSMLKGSTILTEERGRISDENADLSRQAMWAGLGFRGATEGRMADAAARDARRGLGSYERDLNKDFHAENEGYFNLQKSVANMDALFDHWFDASGNVRPAKMDEAKRAVVKMGMEGSVDNAMTYILSKTYDPIGAVLTSDQKNAQNGGLSVADKISQILQNVKSGGKFLPEQRVVVKSIANTFLESQRQFVDESYQDYSARLARDTGGDPRYKISYPGEKYRATKDAGGGGGQGSAPTNQPKSGAAIEGAVANAGKAYKMTTAELKRVTEELVGYEVNPESVKFVLDQVRAGL